jgi:CubicO group peptidase (beta-lactamase class C family)
MHQRRHMSQRPNLITRAAVAIGVGGVALLAAPSAHAQHNACIEAIVNAHVPPAPSSNVPGIIVGVVDGCNGADLYFFGDSDPSTGAPFTATSILSIASVTKTFTGTLVVGYGTGQFPTSGHTVSLTNSINDYLPTAYQVLPPDPKAGITLTMLLDHSSGVPRDDSASSIPSLYAAYDSSTLLFPPGTSAAYSNFGYNVAGRLMETTLGPAYEDQIINTIVSPLGLPDTNFMHSENGSDRFTASQMARVVRGYDCSTSPCTPFAPGQDFGVMYDPAGGLWSTPSDLIAYLEYHIGYRAAPPAIAATMATIDERGDVWGTDSAVPAGWHYKSGSGIGFESFVAYNPTEQRGMFVIGNSDQFLAKEPVGVAIVDALATSACLSCCSTVCCPSGEVYEDGFGCHAPCTGDTIWCPVADGCETVELCTKISNGPQPPSCTRSHTCQ